MKQQLVWFYLGAALLARSVEVDVLVIDTPPLVVTTEALEFVPVAKVVVLVGRIGRTTTDAAERAEGLEVAA